MAQFDAHIGAIVRHKIPLKAYGRFKPSPLKRKTRRDVGRITDAPADTRGVFVHIGNFGRKHTEEVERQIVMEAERSIGLAVAALVPGAFAVSVGVVHDRKGINEPSAPRHAAGRNENRITPDHKAVVHESGARFKRRFRGDG